MNNLYQEIIIDHNKSPRNFGAMHNANLSIEGVNPLCGDQLMLYLKLDGDKITDIMFDGHGCAISIASASLMTEAVKGKTIEEAKAIFHQFHDMVVEEQPINTDQLHKLSALAGVRDYPSRVKCAVLCWHALHGLVSGKQESVHTE